MQSQKHDACVSCEHLCLLGALLLLVLLLAFDVPFLTTAADDVGLQVRHTTARVSCATAS
jgi:hypothetical protein